MNVNFPLNRISSSIESDQESHSLLEQINSKPPLFPILRNIFSTMTFFYQNRETSIYFKAVMPENEIRPLAITQIKLDVADLESHINLLKAVKPRLGYIILIPMVSLIAFTALFYATGSRPSDGLYLLLLMAHAGSVFFPIVPLVFFIENKIDKKVAQAVNLIKIEEDFIKLLSNEKEFTVFLNLFLKNHQKEEYSIKCILDYFIEIKQNEGNLSQLESQKTI